MEETEVLSIPKLEFYQLTLKAHKLLLVFNQQE